MAGLKSGRKAPALSRAAHYHVWEMAVRDRTAPIRHVNRYPLELKAAKELARIGAAKGKHDRAVTTSPRGRQGFRVIAQYQARTGDNVTRDVYRRVRSRVTDEAPAPAGPAPEPSRQDGVDLEHPGPE